MSTIPFPHNKNYSVGVEIELQLLSPETFDLTPLCPELLKLVPIDLQHNFKAEFIQSMLEIITDKCDTIAETADNLQTLCSALDSFCSSIECLPYCASLHPFTILEQRQITDNIRYHQIMDELQIVGKRLITQGLHIHIGLPDPATAIRVNNSIRIFLPVLLAITASSPFFLGEDTGFQSYRSKLFESLPHSGMPTHFSDWNQFENYMSMMSQSGAIKSIREVWWDVRPHPEFGTVEIRICDLPARLDQILAIISIVQALVASLAKDKSAPQLDYNALLNNKWQASRYGTQAKFIVDKSGLTKTVQQVYREMLSYIEPQLQTFNSFQYIDALDDIFDSGNPAERYRNCYNRSLDHSECIKQIQGEFWS